MVGVVVVVCTTVEDADGMRRPAEDESPALEEEEVDVGTDGIPACSEKYDFLKLLVKYKNASSSLASILPDGIVGFIGFAEMGVVLAEAATLASVVAISWNTRRDNSASKISSEYVDPWFPFPLLELPLA